MSSKTLVEYLKLTKPTIMLLVLLTGATALVMEGSLLSEPVDFTLILFGLFLTGGAANALNQFFERDIDSRMGRTSKKRPLPQGKLSARQALIFAIVIGVVGVLLFGLVFNWLSAALALGTVLFYSLFYTLWLKPNTHQNIVIGGAAGISGRLHFV
jgi:protoheme IX farnesyltransferase